MSKAVRLASLALSLTALSLVACGKDGPPPEDPTKVEKKPEKHAEAPKGPAMEYDLGPIDIATWKQKVTSLKGKWNDCYLAAAGKNPTLEGKLTFTVRTRKDGTVKWAFVKESSLGDRAVERCILDSIREQNYGPPMDAREGEAAHTYGWELDGDDHRPADPAATTAVSPAINGVKAKIAACRAKASSKGTLLATFYIAKGGKPLSVGLSVSDAEGEAAADCIVEVLMAQKYVNKSSWTTKVTTELP